jgi:hypothetical protein
MIWLRCKEASLLASQSLDRRLRLSERIMLRAHLFVCEACTRFKRQIEFLRRAMRQEAAQIDNEHLAGLSEEARVRIRQSLQRD